MNGNWSPRSPLNCSPRADGRSHLGRPLPIHTPSFKGLRFLLLRSLVHRSDLLRACMAPPWTEAQDGHAALSPKAEGRPGELAHQSQQRPHQEEDHLVPHVVLSSVLPWLLGLNMCVYNGRIWAKRSFYYSATFSPSFKLF